LAGLGIGPNLADQGQAGRIADRQVVPKPARQLLGRNQSGCFWGRVSKTAITLLRIVDAATRIRYRSPSSLTSLGSSPSRHDGPFREAADDASLASPGADSVPFGRPGSTVPSNFSSDCGYAAEESLADYLSFLLPPGADLLVDAQARRCIEAAARMMPAIPRIAVELRLAIGMSQVDLQQCLRREAGDYARLAEHLYNAPTDPGDATGRARLRSFAHALCGSAIGHEVEELFLEYDLPSSGEVPSLPSVFLSLPIDQERARNTIGEAARLLRESQFPDAVQASIDRCFASCEGDASISHVGMMLSRPVDLVRLNVKGVRFEEVEPFLARCGWQGDFDAALPLLEAASRADRFTLALDLGAMLLPRLGLECFFDDQPADDQSWPIALNALVEQGLCDPHKAAAFLKVPGDVLPSDVQGWPISEIYQSLVGGQSRFSTFARRAVHFKITLDAAGQREAKAYFGADHLWITPDPAAQRWRPSLATPRPRQSVSPPITESDLLDRSVSAGVAFLLEQHQQSGFWRDFRVGDALSDEWVSAFAAAQLAETGEPQALSAAAECWRALVRSQRCDGGWGYSRDYPPDADSTAWALRLAGLLGTDGEPVERGRTFLARHLCEGGGVTTYAEQASLAIRIGLSPGASFAGWRQPHVCVSAAVAPLFPAAIGPYLREAQRDGRWPAYWWSHDAYATALSVEFLAAAKGDGDAKRVAEAVEAASRWAGKTSGTCLSVFDAAWCLRTLCAGSTPSASAAAVAESLIERQDADGSWPSSACLKVPMPGATDPARQDALLIPDQRRIFTTAAAIGALSRYR
jgi:hypothetical protein